jgi:hypothetical protein
VLITALAAEPLVAQRAALAPARSVVAPRSPAVIVGAAVLVETTPPAYETVEIPRPAELPRGVAANYTVTAMSGLRILGPTSGTLAAHPSSSGGESLLLTIAVPKTVEAGNIEVARVRFSAASAAMVDVPIHVQVGAAPGIQFIVASGTQRVASGGRLILRYGVANTGNRAEAVTISVVAPAGWRVAPRETRVDLPVGAIAERTVQIDVPAGGNTGSAAVQLIAVVGDVPLARAAVNVLVVPRASRSTMGPMLTTSAALASGPGGPQEAWSASLAGPVSNGINVSGQVSNAEALSRSANLALLRVGGDFMRPASVMLESASWAIGAGYGAHQGTALTGIGLSGNGLSSLVRADRWEVGAFTATPAWGTFDLREGRLSGMRAAVDAGDAVVSASDARLTERGHEDRGLDALGFGVDAPSFWRGALSTEVAHRRFSSGSGLGFGLQFARQSPDENIRVRILRAPGGRAAFAEASEQLSASVSRRLTKRLDMFADYWSSRDDANTTLSIVRSGGASTGARLSLTRNLTAGVGFRESRFGANGVAGDMEQGESGFEANLDYQGRLGFASLRSNMGSLTRRTATPDAEVSLVDTGNRASIDGAIGVRAGQATVRLEGRYERTDRGAGVFPQRGELTFRVERLGLLSRGEFAVRANGEVRRIFLAGFGNVGVSASAGLEASLPFGVSVAWAAERNPFYFAMDGGRAWAHALRVERRTSLPSLRRSGQAGMVFRDVNGNGSRDDGESGLPGALVRQDGVTAVTDPNGAFRLAEPLHAGVPALDPMSLEAGWVAGRAALRSGRHEFAVVPVAPMVVILAVEDPQGIVTTDTLAPAAVVARHESGRMWVARRSGADSATFDALPPGRYSLQLDLTAVAVPLTVVGTLPTFEVGSARPAEIRIVLTPRQLRIRQLSPPSNGPPTS